MMQDYRFYADRKKALEAQIQQADETIAVLGKNLADWAGASMPDGGRVVHAGLAIERRPLLEIRCKGDQEALCADLERKIPALVHVERKINTAAVAALADDAEMMRRLEAVGICVTRKVATRFELSK